MEDEVVAVDEQEVVLGDESEVENTEQTTEADIETATDIDTGEIVIAIDDNEKDDSSVIKKMRIESEEAKKSRRKLREENIKLKENIKQYTEKASPELGKKPHPDDYEYGSDQYEKDLEQYIERKRIVDKKADDKKADEETQAQAWQSQVDDYGEKKTKLNVKNFDELEDNVKDVLSLTQQGIIIQASENSALIMLALGTNPIKAKEMASITDPVKFAVAIGRMEAKMKVTNRKVETGPEKKVTSNGGSNSPLDSKLEKLEADAAKSGDRTKIINYKREQRKK